MPDYPFDRSPNEQEGPTLPSVIGWLYTGLGRSVYLAAENAEKLIQVNFIRGGTLRVKNAEIRIGRLTEVNLDLIVGRV